MLSTSFNMMIEVHPPAGVGPGSCCDTSRWCVEEASAARFVAVGARPGEIALGAQDRWAARGAASDWPPAREAPATLHAELGAKPAAATLAATLAAAFATGRKTDGSGLAPWLVPRLGGVGRIRFFSCCASASAESNSNGLAAALGGGAAAEMGAETAAETSECARDGDPLAMRCEQREAARGTRMGVSSTRQHEARAWG